MAITYLTGINLNQNELNNAQIQNLGADPSTPTPVEGQIYFNTVSDKLRVYAGGAWGDVAPQGDITAVALKGAGNTGSQLAIASASGPIPTFEILTGAVADGQNYLVDSQAVFNAIASSGSGTVTSVSTGNANTITIGGTAAAPTVAANTAAVSDGGTNLATGDQIYDFVTAFGYTTNTGTVTSVSAGDGIRVTGTAVAPIVNVAYSTATNYILAGGAAAGPAVGTDVIAFSDTSSTNTDVVKVALEDIPMAALGSVKAYVDTAVAGSTSFQGGYDANTNVPNLDATPTITIEKGMQWVVTADGSFFTEQVRIGDLLIANVDAPTALASWTTVQGNVDLATTTIAGIASFSADNFAVSAAGAVTIKDNGVILGTETTGNYVAAITTAGDGLAGAVASEGSTAALSLTLGSIAAGSGTDFVMADSGDAGSQYLTSLATVAGVVNGRTTFAATITANATVTHNLGTKDVIVQLYDVTTFDTVYADIDRATTNTVGVSFGATPTNSIRVLVQKIG